MAPQKTLGLPPDLAAAKIGTNIEMRSGLVEGLGKRMFLILCDDQDVPIAFVMLDAEDGSKIMGLMGDTLKRLAQ